MAKDLAKFLPFFAAAVPLLLAVFVPSIGLPESEISIFENCESGTNDIADFYFYEKDNEILNEKAHSKI